MSTVLVRRRERRQPPQLPRGEILLESPPELPEVVTNSFQNVLMYLPMAAGSGAMVFMFMNPNANIMQMVAGGMFALSMFGMMFGQLGQNSGERKNKLNGARRDYLRYLGQVRQRVRKAAKQQREALEWNNPIPGRLWSMVISPRLWERRTGDPDFAQVRIGSGPQRLAVQLIPPETKPVEDLEPMSAGALRRFLRAHSTVPDLPVAISLRSFARILPDGDAEAVYGMVRALIMQLAAFHSPDDVRITVCASPDRMVYWQWMKWLPHSLHPTEYDAAGQVRLLTGSLVELESLLGSEIKDRGLFGSSRVPAEPFHLVIMDGGQASYDSQIASDGIDGVCVIDLTGSVAQTNEATMLRLRVTPERIQMVKRDRTGKEVLSPVGRPDRASLAEAEALARQLAPFRTSAADEPEEDVLAANMTLTSLLHIDNPYAVDPAVVWRPRPQRSRLRVPIGLDADGRPLELDIKESAQGGMGPHGLCIGATGSGKSELLRTLVLGLAITHSPEVLNFVLVDFKGGATFLGMEGLRHVSAIITNLEDELPLVDRMYDALHGEMVRRQEHLRKSGNYASLRDYEKARLEGAPLPPMPTLFIVLDEFSELLSAKPDFAELFVMIGRLGRSLGVHLLLASQRLEEGKLRGLDTHLSYRIGLRTFSAMESRVVLGVPDAYELPPAPGNGYLKFATEPLVRFKAAYVSGPVDEVQETHTEGPQIVRQVLPYLTDYIRPQVVEQPQPEQPQPEENKSSESLFDVVVRQLVGHGPEPHQIWLPPLDVPPTLDELLPPLSPTARHGFTADGWEWRGRLHAVVGLVDRPFDQRRDPYWLDLSGGAGHVGVVGGPQTGKSTMLRTLITSLALLHTPQEVQFYCLDFGGGTLAAMADLPHMGSVATRLDADRIRRTVAEVSALLEQREREFAERGIDSMAAYRRMRATTDYPGDGYGDVFLIVDNWLTLRQDYEALEESITQLAARGLGYGIHVVVSSNKWSEYRTSIRDLLGTKLELRLGDPYESEVDRKKAANVPENRPGRGLSRDGYHFLTALPRIDGDPSDETLAEGVATTIKAVREAWSGPVAPPVRLLPDLLPASRLPNAAETGTRIPIGIDEESLSPVYLDFNTDPHLLVIGDAECGKSNLLRLIASGIAERYTPKQARMIFIDYSRSLLDVATTEHQIGYAASSTAANSLVRDIHGAMESRLPPADLTPDQLRSRSWWTGAELFLIIDDYEMVATSDNPLRPLVELLPQARDIGLHLIIARSMGGAGRALYEPVIQRIKEMASPGLIMSGNKDEGVLLGNVKPHKLPPGRGYFVERRSGTRLIQTAHREE